MMARGFQHVQPDDEWVSVVVVICNIMIEAK